MYQRRDVSRRKNVLGEICYVDVSEELTADANAEVKAKFNKSFHKALTTFAMVQLHLIQYCESGDKLAPKRSPMSEEDQVMTLLRILPSSYGVLITTFGAQVEKITC